MTEPIVDDESPHLAPKNASPKRSSPERQSPSPNRRSPSPKRSSLERLSPSPKRRSPSPKRRSPSPKRRSPSPKRRSPSPKRSSPERRTSKRISSSPKRRSPSPKRLPDTQSFQYDTYVDLTGEGGSFATAAQLATLEKRNKALMSSIEKLEDKLYESEDRRLVVQRKLLIAEEESADYRTLLDQIESQNAQIRKELDQLGVKFQNENSRFNEVDNENHKLENKAALIKSEVEVNSRAQSKLEQALAEIENLRQKLVSMLKEKEEIDMTVAQREKEVSELEKRLYSESLRSREINTRTVTNLESLIESERNRAQQAIDYVRQTLKAKIRVLEAQIETDTESDTKIKKEKREVARQLKLVKRKLDEKRSEVGRDKRRIETLSKQVDALKERLEKVTIDSSDLEQRHHALKREVGTLSIQLDAAHYTNAKLNVLIPNNVRLAIEEEAIVETGKKEIPLETYSKKSQVELTDDNLFDTSVNLDTTSKPITSDD